MATASAKKESAKPAARKAAPKKETVKAASETKKVWHITKRTDDNLWQVKAEGAQKATRTFTTKKEAEEFVKTLKSNNEGSRVVSHKKDGSFQKK